MRKLPLVPTILVGLAVAAMIALGVWQLQRRDDKAALIALYESNTAKHIAYPELAPVPDEALFRLSSVNCLEVTGWRIEGGRAADGSTGYRRIAMCRTGAEGPGALVDMGIARAPEGNPAWRGGRVAGRIATEPVKSSAFARLLGGPNVPPRPVLVAATPAPGLAPSAPPSVADIPDNHLAYAVQWFLFAAAATLIYALALRRRGVAAPRARD